MDELGKIWPHIFKDRGFVARAPVLLILTPLWPRVVGKTIARETRPVAFCDGTLTVAASSECWVIQLRNMSEQVRCQINGFLGGPVVKKLRLRRHASWDAQVSAGPAKEKPRLPDAAATDRWAQSGVKLEGDLAGIVERSFVKYFSRNGKDTKRCC
ncbi:MAG: DciA family protein [Terriglobia bacterium]